MIPSGARICIIGTRQMFNSIQVALKRAIDSWERARAQMRCQSICCKSFESGPSTTNQRHQRKYRLAFMLADRTKKWQKLTLVNHRHADILCIMVDFVLGKIWLHVLSTAKLYPETTLEGPSTRKMLLHPHPTQPQQIQTRNTLAK